MKTNRASVNWVIDAVLFGGFILLFFLDLTGLALHQWLGLAGGALALYHLLAHWEWVEAVSRRLFGRTNWKARLFYLVDTGLLIGFLAILSSGLLISTWLRLPLAAGLYLENFHVTASILTLLLVLVKIGLHGRWIVKTARRMAPQPGVHALDKTASPQVVPLKNARPAAVAVNSERRDFLKLMGLVGVGAALALLNVALPGGESEAQANALHSQASATNSTLGTGNHAGTALTASSASTCYGRCPKGRSCSFPGHCRQYTDNNNNGRCDLGECSS